MATPSAETVPPLVDAVDAPVIFADVLEGGGPLQGNLNLTFSVLQLDHSKNPPALYRRVCLRLVMPPATGQATVDFITRLLQQGQSGQPSTANPMLQ